MARSRGEMTRQEEVHEFLAKLSSTHFFFLYLVGLNVDYETLKALSHKIYELSSSTKYYLGDFLTNLDYFSL